MNKEEHIAKHIELHDSLDQLLADFIRHTKKLLGRTTLLEFLGWSHEQISNPTELEDD